MDTPSSFNPVDIYFALILQGSREASWTPNITGNVLQSKRILFSKSQNISPVFGSLLLNGTLQCTKL